VHPGVKSFGKNKHDSVAAAFSSVCQFLLIQAQRRRWLARLRRLGRRIVRRDGGRAERDR
jgi:hypothetical protein